MKPRAESTQLERTDSESDERRLDAAEAGPDKNRTLIQIIVVILKIALEVLT